MEGKSLRNAASLGVTPKRHDTHFRTRAAAMPHHSDILFCPFNKILYRKYLRWHLSAFTDLYQVLWEKMAKVYLELEMEGAIDQRQRASLEWVKQRRETCSPPEAVELPSTPAQCSRMRGATFSLLFLRLGLGRGAHLSTHHIRCCGLAATR